MLSCRCTRKVVIDDAGVHRKIRIDQPRSRYVPQRIYMHIPQITGTVRVWTGLGNDLSMPNKGTDVTGSTRLTACQQNPHPTGEGSHICSLSVARTGYAPFDAAFHRSAPTAHSKHRKQRSVPVARRRRQRQRPPSTTQRGQPCTCPTTASSPRAPVTSRVRPAAVDARQSRDT